MSTTAKKKSVRGVRYTDAQKKEVVDFVATFNAANGRGGQSKAATKFGVSPLTVMAWLKGAGASKAGKKVKAAKAPKVAKKAKAAKAPKASKGKSKATVGTRYTPDQKQEVVDFVVSYNSANGRGGQSRAAAKFGISPLTVMAWLKSSGAPKVGRKVKVAKVAKAAKAAKDAGFDAKLKALVVLNRQIEKSEAGTAALKAKFSKLLGSL